jgi:hypothetical protein
MPCEVVLLKVDFFKMAAVAMETAKMDNSQGDVIIIIIIVKKKRRIAIHHPTAVGEY